MRRLTEQSGGNLTGHFQMLKLTCWRNSRRPNRRNPPHESGRRQREKYASFLWPHDLTWAGKGHGLPVWTTKILCCQTWDFSSSVELSAAVLKRTPGGGLETLPLSKNRQEGTCRTKRDGACHSRPAPTVAYIRCGMKSLVIKTLSNVLWKAQSNITRAFFFFQTLNMEPIQHIKPELQAVWAMIDDGLLTRVNLRGSWRAVTHWDIIG